MSQSTGHFAKEKALAIHDFEVHYVCDLLNKHPNNHTAAAFSAGLSQPALHALLRRTGFGDRIRAAVPRARKVRLAGRRYG